MMPRRLETVEEIFHAALDCAPDQLSAFLEKKCAGDESLRRKVEELLAAHRQPESLIEGPLATLAASVVASGQTNSSVGQAISNYEILGEIGRGGMGVIYRARQRHSTRIVALKRIVSYHADSRETLERFRREAEAAASLDHPNILPIYEIGQGEDGLPFFSMKYAAGGSLQKAGSALRSKSRECVVRLMAKVARAVQYAHEHGVLHRDLKPGNVLLDSRGEPFVTDFGLAKWLDTNTDLTRTLTIFGTPGYIAPEQAKGPAAKLTAAADVYSLGAILFNLFTGRPPFLGEHALAVIQQATERPAPKLRSLAPALDRDLETIARVVSSANRTQGIALLARWRKIWSAGLKVGPLARGLCERQREFGVGRAAIPFWPVRSPAVCCWRLPLFFYSGRSSLRLKSLRRRKASQSSRLKT
jgi:serine/threonine protein kinase